MEQITTLLERLSLRELTLVSAAAGLGVLSLAIAFGNPLALI